MYSTQNTELVCCTHPHDMCCVGVDRMAGGIEVKVQLATVCCRPVEVWGGRGALGAGNNAVTAIESVGGCMPALHTRTHSSGV